MSVYLYILLAYYLLDIIFYMDEMHLHTTKQYHTGKSVIILLWPILGILGTIFLCQLPSILSLIGLVAGVVVIVFSWHNFINYCTFKIISNDKNIIIKQGIIKKENTEYLLSHVNGIILKQGIIGKLLEYGTITLIISGCKQPPLEKIKDPDLLKDFIYSKISNISSVPAVEGNNSSTDNMTLTTEVD